MTQKPNDIGPERVIKTSRSSFRLFPVLAVLAVLALAGGAAYLLAPESLARLQGKLRNEPLEIHHLTLAVGRQTFEISPGGVIEIHPGQHFAVSGLNTSRWLNYDLRLSSPDFDVTQITGGAEATPMGLLSGAFGDAARELRLEVVEGEEVRAAFTVLSRFTALDFAARGDAAATPGEKAENYQKALTLDPGSTHLRDKLIAALIDAGQADRAAGLYEEELVRTGRNEEILIRLLDLYTDLNLPERVAGTLTRLILLARDQDRSPVDYQRQLADFHKQGGRLAQAAEIYEAMALEAPPERAAAYLSELVELYRDSRQTGREIETLKRLLEVSPPEQSAGIWSEIVALYEASGDDEGRLTAWRELAELLPDGQNKANAYKVIARLLTRSEDYGEARAAYQSALKQAPEDLNVHLNLARLAAATGDQAGYRDFLSKAIALAPDNLELRRELADALRAQGANARARAQYLEILARAPGDQATRLTLIDLLDTMKDRDGLIVQYQALMAAHPDDKVLPYNLGVLFFEKKQWPQAVEAFKKVAALDPNDIEARDYLLIIYQRTNQRPEIMASALDLYSRDPSKTVYRTLMLNTQENAKDWKGYVRAAEECAKLTPDDPAAWQLLAKGQARLNQKTEAAQSLWKAAEVTREKPKDAWLAAAKAFAALGRSDRALQAYRKVQDIEPNNEQAAKAILELELKAAQGQS